MAATAERAEPDLTTSDLIEVRRSNVHGLGVFAAQRIPKGTRIIEYVGERVSHDEADRRYEEKDANDSHTFLFIVDSKTVIDAGVDGNDARFFNHSCDPNCESTVEKRRVYIEAIRDIDPGAELTYDYQIQREDDDPDNIDDVFACRCGFPQCRGTMLWPTERKPKRKKAKRRGGSQAKGKAGAKTQAKTGSRGTAKTGARGGAKTNAAAKSTARTHSRGKSAGSTHAGAGSIARTNVTKKKSKRGGRRR
jgi:uncharacterized protein